ncbi:unnamed protein product, partial [Iphiclides podalirius]
MPKRKRSKEDTLERLQRKIQKLEEKLHRIHSDVAESGASPNREGVIPLTNSDTDTPELRPDEWLIDETPDEEIEQNQAVNSSIQPDFSDPTPLSGPSTSYNVTLTEDDLLEILGEDPSNKNNYGPEIRSELANRMSSTPVAQVAGASAATEVGASEPRTCNSTCTACTAAIIEGVMAAAPPTPPLNRVKYAGRLSLFLNQWSLITSDRKVLS